MATTDYEPLFYYLVGTTMETDYEAFYLRTLVRLDEIISSLQARAIGCDFIKEHLDAAVEEIEWAKHEIKGKLYQHWSSTGVKNLTQSGGEAE